MIGFGIKNQLALGGGSGGSGSSEPLGYLLNAIGLSSKGSQAYTGPASNLALDYQGNLVDFGGSVNTAGVLASAIKGSRLSAGVVYDTDLSGNPLHPRYGLDYRFYPQRPDATLVTLGDFYFAISSDGVKRYYEVTTQGVTGTGTIMPTSGTVNDGTAVFTTAGKYTLSGQRTEGPATNKTTCQQVNPTGTDNLFKAGDASTTLTVVDDTTELTAAGLIDVCTSGAVYKLDNTAGSTDGRVLVRGPVLNLNKHTMSIYARSVLGTAFMKLGGAVGNTVIPNAGYFHIVSANLTPAEVAHELTVVTPPGETAYFILPQLEESSFATSIMADDVAAAVSRSATDLTIQTTDTALTTEEGAGRIVFTPLDGFAAFTHVLGIFIDFNNKISVQVKPNSILLDKEVLGVHYIAEKSISVAAGLQYIVDFSYSNVDGMAINVTQVGDVQTAPGANADTSLVQLPSYITIGALDNVATTTSYFSATYESVRLFKNTDAATTGLLDWSI